MSRTDGVSGLVQQISMIRTVQRKIVLRHDSASLIPAHTAWVRTARLLVEEEDMLIGIEGCIGAGKTTLLQFFSHVYPCCPIYEEKESNPFAEDFSRYFSFLDVLQRS